MGLKNHIIKQDDIRLEYKDLIIKQVTHEKKQAIKEFMVTNFIVNENGQEIVESTFSGVEFYKFLIINLTNWGEEIKDISDEELENALLNGDDVVQTMLKEFNKICEEIAEEQKNTTLEIVDRLVSVGDTIDYNNKINESLDNVSSKLGISREEVLNLVGNQNQLVELQKLLDAENKTKKPQDHKPKVKRGRKKKSEQVVNLEDSIKSDELKTQLVDTNVEVVE